MTAIIIIIGILIWVNTSSNKYHRRNHYNSDSEYDYYQHPPFHNPSYTEGGYRASEKRREQQALFYTTIFIFLVIVFLMTTR